MLNATVLKTEVLSSGLFELWVKPDESIPDFKPGQYVALGLPDEQPSTNGREKLVKRAYSIASTPHRKDALEFYIAEVENGELSPRLARLGEGDRIFVQKKYVGTFITDGVPDGSNLILVSTGTGIAPFISILRTPEVVSRFDRITFVHGVRYSRDLAYREEILERQEAEPQKFGYFATVSREGPPEWEGTKGYVQQFFTEGLIPVDSEKDHVFLCGNPAMVTELTEWLSERGFKEHKKKDPGNLHFEKYW